MASPSISYELVPWSRLGSEHQRELNRLAQHGEFAKPFMGFEWFDHYVNAFTPKSPHLFMAREDERAVAAVPVHYGTENWMGRAFTVLASMTNRWTPRFELLLQPDGRRSVAAMLARMIELSGCSFAYLDRLPRDSSTVRSVRTDLARSAIRYHFDARSPSPYKDLPLSTDELLSGLGGKFRSNLRNRDRRLRKLGNVKFRVVGDCPERIDALERFLALEEAGWKGTAAGAIRSHADALRFYRSYCADRCSRVSVAFLTVDGIVVAANLFLISASTLFLLKTAYLEDYRPYSPGQLITHHLMNHAIEQGVRRFDFLGIATEWKLDWSCKLHENACLYVFADSLAGRAAYWTRFGIRQQLKRVGPLRNIVRWLRASRRP